MSGHTILIAVLLSLAAGLSTGVGSLISLTIKKLESKHLSFILGFSAGVMIYISFMDLIPQAINQVGFLQANLAFFGGIIIMAGIDFLVPHDYIAEKFNKNGFKDSKLIKAGLLTFIGIAIHNFPEGLAVGIVSLEGLRFGIPLALAIALHNIPEGIAVAIPIYAATKSKKKSFWFSLLSGITEPVGALIGILILLPILSQNLIYGMFAFVAGIMVFISFDELLPICFANYKGHIAIAGLILGMGIMATSLFII